MSGLKACPFCSTPPDGPGHETHTSWFIGCSTCGAAGPFKDTEPEAVAAWNQRTDPLQDAVNRLRLFWLEEAKEVTRIGEATEVAYRVGHKDARLLAAATLTKLLKVNP